MTPGDIVRVRDRSRELANWLFGYGHRAVILSRRKDGQYAVAFIVGYRRNARLESFERVVPAADIKETGRKWSPEKGRR